MKTSITILLFLVSINVPSQISLLGDIDNAPVRAQQQAQSITASIPFQGYDENQAFFGQGEFEIFLDNTTGILDKPIIILDGFDPGDSRDINGLYNSLNFEGQNIADILRDEGFDIIILNAPTYMSDGVTIDGGGDFIQRNAFVLIELINLINNDKVGDEELVVLGPSMGGLIARYGLAFMEANNLDPDTRLYISFDAPHNGANVPISLQYLVNFLAVQSGDPDAQQAAGQLLGSAAAQEMLVDHLFSHLLEGSDFEQDPTLTLPAGAPDFRDAFQAELDALGFPQTVRNVAMVNGSGAGTTIGVPGMQVVDTTLDLGSGLSAQVVLNFMPPASQTIEVTQFDTSLGPIPVQSFGASGESEAVSDGVDSAPGGVSSISNALGGGGNNNDILTDFIDALDQDEFSFIPLISALAIENEDDWYATPDLNNSPFAATFIPTINEPHITVTQASAQFALDEIRNGVLSVSDVSTLGDAFRLLQNPIDDVIRVAINDTTFAGATTATLFSIEGKEIKKQVYVAGSSQITMQQQLASGIYILTVTNQAVSQSFKVVVR